jgi:hypothetical protein
VHEDVFEMELLLESVRDSVTDSVRLIERQTTIDLHV